jgi:hypothetical protein
VIRARQRSAVLITDHLALITLATLFVARRISGALTTPLGTLSLLVTACAVAGCALLARRLRLRSSRHSSIASAVISFAVLAIAAALSLPGTNVFGIVVLWTIVVAEEAWSWRRLLRKNVEQDAAAEAPTTESDLVQQIMRLRTSSGEMVEARLRADFAQGQRVANVHVAFCPPFAVVPIVEFEQTSGPEARVRIGQLLPQGVRLDLKLATPGPASVEIALSAEASNLVAQAGPIESS